MMNKREKNTGPILRVLYADDDVDDRYFFDKALKEIGIPNNFTSVEDGDMLMDYLEATKQLPDVIFLDLNMPRKTGFECLSEIKSNSRLQNIPVIICSTYCKGDVADVLYEGGAHYYIRKDDYVNLKRVLADTFEMMKENDYKRPLREHFILGLVEA